MRGSVYAEPPLRNRVVESRFNALSLVMCPRLTTTGMGPNRARLKQKNFGRGPGTQQVNYRA